MEPPICTVIFRRYGCLRDEPPYMATVVIDGETYTENAWGFRDAHYKLYIATGQRINPSKYYKVD